MAVVNVNEQVLWFTLFVFHSDDNTFNDLESVAHGNNCKPCVHEFDRLCQNVSLFNELWSSQVDISGVN